MKKTVIIIICAVLVSVAAATVLLFSGITGAEPSVTKIVAEVKQTTAKYGDIIDVIVSVKDDNSAMTEGLGGVQYELPYDSSKLSLVSAEVNAALFDISENFNGLVSAIYTPADTSAPDNLFFTNYTNESTPSASTLIFISVCKADNLVSPKNGYSDLGAGSNGCYTLFVAKFQVIDPSLSGSIESVIIPLTDTQTEKAWVSSNASGTFTALGTQTASTVEITPESLQTKALTNAILNMYIQSYNINNEATITLFNASDTDHTTPIRTVSDVTSTVVEDGKIKDVFGDIYNLEAGTYDMEISKPFHLTTTINGIVVDGSGAVNFPDGIPEVTLTVGDVDGDGVIGISDLALVVADYQKDLTESTHNSSTECTDVDGDGVIGITDLALIVAGYQQNGETYTYGE